MHNMRKYLIHVLFISFVFSLTPITHAEEPRINLRSSYGKLSVSQVQSISNISIRRKKDWGFYGHSTINHNYNLKSINGDKIVVDHATGLMWHQSGSKKYMKYKKADKWLKNLNKKSYAGYHNWRLPTVEEAASLLESGKRNDLFIDAVFNNYQQWIWTGDKYDSGAAWAVYFYGGLVYWGDVSSYGLCVRPVRALQSNSAFKESYKDWQPYKDYLRLPDGYHSPAMEKSYKDSYEAEKIVKYLPCSKGGTLDQYFSKKPKPPLEDLGWNEFPGENGVDVVRTFLLNPSESLETLEYKWHVDSTGKVKAINDEAIGITK